VAISGDVVASGGQDGTGPLSFILLLNVAVCCRASTRKGGDEPGMEVAGEDNALSSHSHDT
jgi:hypothetical protein